MEVRKYLPNDYETLQGWMQARGTHMPPPLHLSDRGFLVPGIACIFLYKTFSNLAWLEYFVSNPQATDDERLEAFKAGMAEVKKECKQAGITRILCYTALPAVIAAASVFGFKHNEEPFFQLSCEE